MYLDLTVTHHELISISYGELVFIQTILASIYLI